MRIRVHRETRPDERRVALVPRGVTFLIESRHDVIVPPGVGNDAGFLDEEYETAGATLGDGEACDLLLGIGPLTAEEAAGAGTVIGFLNPLAALPEMQNYAAAGIDAYAMELVPRSTQAQVMDALSSQATAAGYEAVLLAASASPHFFPMLMTAAGTIRPARVLVLGAGVAGLQAIATARRLGAVTAGYDIRPAAREQVESLGASFVGGPVVDESEMSGGYAKEVDADTRAAQQEALTSAVADSDVVITTAQVPGRQAPLLVTTAMVDSMRPGSVIVDLAAGSGGNCEVTEADAVVDHGGVQIHGPLELASNTARDASEMYSRNVTALVDHLFGEEAAAEAEDDEIAAATCVVRDGRIVHERVLAALEGMG